MNLFKTQILQLTVDVVQTQTVRNRRINLKGLLRNAAAFVRAHGLHGGQIVQTVGQLNQDDAHIVRHGEQHFAKTLGLLRFLGVKREFV